MGCLGPGAPIQVSGPGVPLGAKAKWGVEDTWGGCCLWDSGKLGATRCTWGGKSFRLCLEWTQLV